MERKEAELKEIISEICKPDDKEATAKGAKEVSKEKAIKLQDQLQGKEPVPKIRPPKDPKSTRRQKTV